MPPQQGSQFQAPQAPPQQQHQVRLTGSPGKTPCPAMFRVEGLGHVLMHLASRQLGSDCHAQHSGFRNLPEGVLPQPPFLPAAMAVTEKLVANWCMLVPGQ